MPNIKAILENSTVPYSYGLTNVLEFSSDDYTLNALLQFEDVIKDGKPCPTIIQDMLSWSPTVRDTVSQWFFASYKQAKDVLDSPVHSHLWATIVKDGHELHICLTQLAAYQALGWATKHLDVLACETYHYFAQNEFILNDEHALDLTENLTVKQLIDLQALIEANRPDDLTSLVKLLAANL